MVCIIVNLEDKKAKTKDSLMSMEPNVNKDLITQFVGPPSMNKSSLFTTPNLLLTSPEEKRTNLFQLLYGVAKNGFE